jgi:hypothetical protein
VEQPEITTHRSYAQPSSSDVVVAFLAAPWIGTLIAALAVTPFFGLFDSWGLYFGFSLLVAYPVALIMGLPIYLLLAKFIGSPTLLHCSLAGTCVAALCAATLPLTIPESTISAGAFLRLTCGVVTGSSVWGILRLMAGKRQTGAA